MTILFMSNNKEDFKKTYPAGAIRETDPTFFDANFVPACIKLGGVSGVDAFLHRTMDAALSEGSWRCTMYVPTGVGGVNTRDALIQIVDTVTVSGSAPVLTGLGISIGMNATAEGTVDFTPVGGAVETFELGADEAWRINVDWRIAADGYITVYVNENIRAQFIGDTTALNNLQAVILRTAGNNRDNYWSEFMWADESTVTGHVSQLLPEAQGTVNDAWDNNSYTNVDDDIGINNDTNTTTPTANDIQQYVMTDLSPYVMAQDLYVRAVHLPIWVRHDTASPQNFQVSCRTEGADYHDANYAGINTGFSKSEWKQEVNPATLAQWTRDQVNAAEIGGKAIA